MDSTLPELYKDYGIYSNWRNMPSAIDGLKPVERRVLYAAYKIARNKLVKSRQIDAYTIGHYHPHGECYGTVVQMVKQGFLEGQGNFGTNVGTEFMPPAAPRYTECAMKQKTIDLAFRYINTVPLIETELNDYEPEFLPTMFPLCLIGKTYTQGIGFGFRTYIPCYEEKDLYKRLLWLLGKRKTKPIVSPITDCIILSDNNVLDELLKTGTAKIEVQGVLDINIRTSTVALKSWPPGKKFQSILNKFSKELNDNMIGFTDLSSETTNIVFQVLRERNRSKIFEAFIEKLKEAVTGFISFENTIVNNNVPIVSPIDKMLLNTHKVFSSINKITLEKNIEVLSQTISEYEMLEKMKEPLTDSLAKKLEYDDSVRYISEKTEITQKNINELLQKYRIKKLLTLNTDTTQLQNERTTHSNNLKDLDTFILTQYGDYCSS